MSVPAPRHLVVRRQRLARVLASTQSTRAEHARQRIAADTAVRELLERCACDRTRASMLRAVTASATDALAATTDPISVASMLCAMSTHFVPAITDPARAQAEAVFTKLDDQEPADGR